jgi:hypothetical protein
VLFAGIKDAAMKFFIVTLLAQRMASDGIEAGVNTLIVLQDTEQSARQEAEQEIVKRFPAEDGWNSYQMSIFEVPPELADDQHKLTWQITPVTSSRVRHEERS